MNKILNNITTELPEIEDHGQEMFGSQDQRTKFRDQKMKEPRQEHQRNTEAKENPSALKGRSMLTMESETTVHKRRRGSFRHDENKHGSSTRLSSPAQEPQPRSDGKHLRRESLSEAGVRLGRDIEDLANCTSVGNARTPRVILGILPCVRITKPNRVHIR